MKLVHFSEVMSIKNLVKWISGTTTKYSSMSGISVKLCEVTNAPSNISCETSDSHITISLKEIF